MNEEGVIFASTQPPRIGTTHEGARKVMNGEIEFAAITEEEAKRMSGVLAGYTGPVTLQGKRIACIGITGDPSQVKPLQQMASLIVEKEILDDMANKEKEVLLQEIYFEIQQISASIEELTASAEEVNSNTKFMETTAVKASQDVNKTNSILATIQTISSQSNLLGLNAAIEAARAGDAGRGFSVVAEEIRKLAATSSNSAKDIEEILKSIEKVVTEIAGSIHEISDVAEQQSAAIQNINSNIIELQNKISKIAK